MVLVMLIVVVSKQKLNPNPKDLISVHMILKILTENFLVNVSSLHINQINFHIQSSNKITIKWNKLTMSE